ncbi:polysaccharide deacetylase family protein [Undibacterium aquatile]|uniref:Polysaccharide deacetylase family protein n=1 Tax=Undibacterium aquatile TaxID=1537398 RepID=A0ABR6XDS7_9BURK|nr:polysaccharide deacetylase family protein [Undibacterium aquatile]MBC3811057.1 polysaccharide deacetylase family protein [Undibacterium aquatile]
MPNIVLKIDVDTFRGTKEGVPNLVRILKQHQAGATFLFSLGKDHTGWALRRAFRPGFFQKVSRTSVVEHYGIKTLMYGVLLPAPDIGNCTTEMRAVADAGFECGIHTWDHVVWHDNVRQRGKDWTCGQMQQAQQKFQQIFGHTPATHGAAGWQMNEHAFVQLDQFGMQYASDGRAMLTDDGSLANPEAGPYRLKVGNEVKSCIQMPTTLPTLDELLGRTVNCQELTSSTIAAHILDLTKNLRDHVFTLHAELEGQKLAPIFEELLTGWHKQGYRCISMADYFNVIKDKELPTYPLSWASLPGRSGELVALI